MEILGTVARLQVQRSRLKPGPRGARTYDPAPLLAVTALEIGPRGAVGLTDAGRVVDVHHADHPDTRNAALRNGLSLLPRAHYDRLRARYGPHLADGVAGESLLLDTAGPWRIEDLTGELLLETDEGSVTLNQVVVAEPCVEFTRWVLGLPAAAGTPPEVLAGLADLGAGARGFYAVVTGSGTVRAGARLSRA